MLKLFSASPYTVAISASSVVQSSHYVYFAVNRIAGALTSDFGRPTHHKDFGLSGYIGILDPAVHGMGPFSGYTAQQ